MIPQIVRARLIPPRPRRHVLPRPRLDAALRPVLEYPLTLVRADAGYGKSTALAALGSLAPGGLFWYSPSETHADALVFLLHIVAAFQTAYPNVGRHAVALLSQQGGAAKHGAAAVDLLMDDLLDVVREDAVLVVDDYHLVDRPDVASAIGRFVEHMPPMLHLVLSGRGTPSLERLPRWRAVGDVLDIGRDELAFTVDEIAELFRTRFGVALGDDYADRLLQETEGWPIALQMVWQHLQVGEAGGLPALLRTLPAVVEGLFDFLAQDVLSRQPAHIQDFLLQTAALQQLDAEACDVLLGRHDSGRLLREIEQQSLFVIALGSGMYRYHHLFREFLERCSRELLPARWMRLHRKAADLCEARGDLEGAIVHAFAAGNHSLVAEILERVALEMIQAGRYETLAAWLARLPETLLRDRAPLLLASGDAARLTSRFDAALQAYERAGHAYARDGDAVGESRALEGVALVYLDTVQPSRAAPFLARARRRMRHVPGARDHRAHLLLLTAENLANRGDLPTAERVQRAVLRAVGAEVAEIDPRIYVRQGRLREARAVATRLLHRDVARAGKRVPRSHRESTAILSWVCAFEGDAASARAYAEDALRVGRELHAPIVETVALSRLGHGWLTGADADPRRALEAYAESLALADQLGVARFRCEPLLGQVIARGMQADRASAERAGREALAILDDAGDRYLSAAVWLALGVARVLVGGAHADAAAALDRGAALARACGDLYLPLLADVWRAHQALRRADWTAFDDAAGRALQASRSRGETAMLVGQPFLGHKSPAALALLLRTAAARGVEGDFAATLLRHLSASTVSPCTPSDALHVRALGPMRVWFGEVEILKSAWRRGKALQLFEYLLCAGGRPVHRDEVLEALWPEVREEAAANGLRVALNALQRTLEPDRPSHRAPRFVRRVGSLLVLDPAVQVDADDLERGVRRAQEADQRGDENGAVVGYREVMSLYRGDFLDDNRYDTWVEARRERLRRLFVRSADRLAECLARRGLHYESIQVSQEVLLRDPCWEPAYARLMRSQAALGNRAQAIRTYERCARVLREELDVQPSAELRALRDELTHSVRV